MKHVTILAFSQALASSMTIPLEMMHAASVIHAIRNKQRNTLQLLTASEDGQTLTLTGGITILPNASIADIAFSELIFVPSLWGNPRAAVLQHRRTVAWLQQQHALGAIICSVGTGSYFLAETGLLEQRCATTHWRYFDAFQSRYPNIKLQRKRFITREDRLYCTGSINAARDVMLHFIEQFYDAPTADEVAHHFTHELKRSYEAMILAGDPRNTHHDEEIIKVQEWLQKNFHTAVNVAELAQQFNINVRSFNRRFRAAAGKAPLQYLQEIRMTEAQELLRKSNLSISEIAFSVGYQDVSHFSGLFRKFHSVTPGEYRHLVRNKLFQARTEE